MNRFFTLLLAASCLTAVGQVPDYVPTDGLIGWWPLDGNALDNGASSIDGIIYGATPGLDRWGDLTGAMRFQNIGDRIELGEISGNIGSPNSALTISCWFKGEAFPNGSGSGPSSGQLVSAYYGPGPRQIRLEVVHGISNGPGDHLKYYWRCPEENDEPVSAYEFSTSNWNHYVMIVDPSNSEIRIMLNGFVVEDLSATYSPENDYMGTETRTWMVGAYYPPVGIYPHQFFGEIDDVGIWNRTLTLDEILEMYNAPAPFMGCNDASACNFNEAANTDDGSCHFNCQFCHDGTVWDEDLFKCIVANPADINFDGCVQLNDLLDLLSAYGDCGAEESAWQCGDPLEYQGYDYETVQIGEQCWFAENCRFLPEVYSSENGSDTIPRAYVLNYDGVDLGVAASLEEYLLGGALYNYPATSSWDLCPADWHVGNDFDWDVLESFASLPDSLADQLGWRGAHAADLKSTQWDGNDSLGFTIIAHGYRDIYPSDTFWGEVGNSAAFWAGEHTRFFQTDFQGVLRGIEEPSYGFSVRCVKDTE